MTPTPSAIRRQFGLSAKNWPDHEIEKAWQALHKDHSMTQDTSPAEPRERQSVRIAFTKELPTEPGIFIQRDGKMLCLQNIYKRDDGKLWAKSNVWSHDEHAVQDLVYCEWCGALVEGEPLASVGEAQDSPKIDWHFCANGRKWVNYPSVICSRCCGRLGPYKLTDADIPDPNLPPSVGVHVGSHVAALRTAVEDGMKLLGDYCDGEFELEHEDGCPEDECSCQQPKRFNDVYRQMEQALSAAERAAPAEQPQMGSDQSREIGQSDFETWMADNFYGRDVDLKVEAREYATVLNYEQALRLATHIWDCMSNVKPPWWSSLAPQPQPVMGVPVEACEPLKEYVASYQARYGKTLWGAADRSLTPEQQDSFLSAVEATRRGDNHYAKEIERLKWEYHNEDRIIHAALSVALDWTKEGFRTTTAASAAADLIKHLRQQLSDVTTERDRLKDECESRNEHGFAMSQRDGNIISELEQHLSTERQKREELEVCAAYYLAALKDVEVLATQKEVSLDEIRRRTSKVIREQSAGASLLAELTEAKAKLAEAEKRPLPSQLANLESILRFQCKIFGAADHGELPDKVRELFADRDSLQARLANVQAVLQQISNCQPRCDMGGVGVQAAFDQIRAIAAGVIVHDGSKQEDLKGEVERLANEVERLSGNLQAVEAQRNGLFAANNSLCVSIEARERDVEKLGPAMEAIRIATIENGHCSRIGWRIWLERGEQQSSLAAWDRLNASAPAERGEEPLTKKWERSLSEAEDRSDLAAVCEAEQSGDSTPYDEFREELELEPAGSKPDGAEAPRDVSSSPPAPVDIEADPSTGELVSNAYKLPASIEADLVAVEKIRDHLLAGSMGCNPPSQIRRYFALPVDVDKFSGAVPRLRLALTRRLVTLPGREELAKVIYDAQCDAQFEFDPWSDTNPLYQEFYRRKADAVLSLLRSLNGLEGEEGEA